MPEHIVGCLFVPRPRNRDKPGWLMPVSNAAELEYLSEALDKLARMENRDCGEGSKYVPPFRKPSWRRQSFFPASGGEVRIETVLTEKGTVRAQEVT